jgi:hypothetical protein
MNGPHKATLLRTYLNDDQEIKNYADRILAAEFSNPQLCQTGAENDIVEVIDEAIFEEFKQNVKTWMDIDTQIKRLQGAITLRRKMQSDLNEKILRFMNDHNIEDLNTREGVLRYKTSNVKAPLTQKAIKEKISEKFKDTPDVVGKIMDVFNDRELKARSSLRRIKY